MTHLFKSCIACVLPRYLAASPIPTYTVGSADYTGVVLSNNASFGINGNSWETPQGWAGGDQIEIHHANSSFIEEFVNIGGYIVAEPLFIVVNNTLGESIEAYLSAPPSVAPMTIASVDQVNGRLTLSDASLWDIHPTDQRFFSVWNNGDPVLIGQNIGFDSVQYDAFIINGTHIQAARAVIH